MKNCEKIKEMKKKYKIYVGWGVGWVVMKRKTKITEKECQNVGLGLGKKKSKRGAIGT